VIWAAGSHGEGPHIVGTNNNSNSSNSMGIVRMVVVVGTVVGLCGSN
jgi:uncharacterized membrane protein YkgB